MSGTPKPTPDKLQSGIKLLSAYAHGEKLPISEKFIEECANAIHIEDPLMKMCYAARSIGINAAIQEVYSVRCYLDRDEVWLIEKDDRMILLDTPVWRMSFRVFDSMTGITILTKKHLAHFLDFSVPNIPYRALILDRTSFRRWAETNPRNYFTERRRWFVKHSGWMGLLGVILLSIYILLLK